jgi:polar amino acid transport system substrate-binding protein
MMRKILWGWLFLGLGWFLPAAELRVVYNEDYRPLSFTEAGTMSGILVELMDELGRRTGVTVVHEGLPWERAQTKVKAGGADAFVTLVNPVRAEYALASSVTLLQVSNRAVTAKSNPQLGRLRKIASIGDASAFRHVAFIGSGWVKNHLATADVTALPSATAIFQFLLSNRADLFVESELVIEYNAQLLNVTDRLEMLPPVFDTVDFRFQVSKLSPFVPRMSEFDGALKAMVDDGTVKKILGKYGHRSITRD